MDDETRDLLRDLHARLEATEELPIDARANRWLGEAQAAAADVLGEEVPESAVRKRVEQVEHLLEQVADTGSAEADEHVDAARDLTVRLAERLADG